MEEGGAATSPASSVADSTLPLPSPPPPSPPLSSPPSPSSLSSPSSFRPAPNHHLLKAMARNGGGCGEYFDSKTKSKWERKVHSQLSKAFQPALTSVSVQWQQFDEDAPKPVQVGVRAHTHTTHTPPHLPSSPPLQAPEELVALFSGSRQVVYGFVPHCKQVIARQHNCTKIVT